MQHRQEKGTERRGGAGRDAPGGRGQGQPAPSCPAKRDGTNEDSETEEEELFEEWAPGRLQ